MILALIAPAFISTLIYWEIMPQPQDRAEIRTQTFMAFIIPFVCSGIGFAVIAGLFKMEIEQK
jgi:hypothetical protein